MVLKGEAGLELVPLLTRLDLSEEEFCKLMHLPLGPTRFDYEHTFGGWLFGRQGSTTVSFRNGVQTHAHHRMSEEPEKDYVSMKENLEKLYGTPQVDRQEEPYEGYPELLWENGDVRITLGCHEYWGCMITTVSFDKG